MKKISRRTYNMLLNYIEIGNSIKANDIISNYTKLLGRGCSRCAYLVRLEDYVPFVLKVEWYPDKSRWGSCQNENEVKVWNRNDHKFLPEIYDYDTKTGQYTWLEMEYLTKAKKIPNSDEIWQFAMSLRLNMSDLFCQSHWGLNSNKEMKVIDFGLGI